MLNKVWKDPPYLLVFWQSLGSLHLDMLRWNCAAFSADRALNLTPGRIHGNNQSVGFKWTLTYLAGGFVNINCFQAGSMEDLRVTGCVLFQVGFGLPEDNWEAPLDWQRGAVQLHLCMSRWWLFFLYSTLGWAEKGTHQRLSLVTVLTHESNLKWNGNLQMPKDSNKGNNSQTQAYFLSIRIPKEKVNMWKSQLIL